MVQLTIQGVDFIGHGYRVHWTVDKDEKELFKLSPLEVSYQLEPIRACQYPINNLLAMTLPILAKEYEKVRVVSEYAIDDALQGYWNRVVRALSIKRFQLEWEAMSSVSYRDIPAEVDPPRSSRIGLLFGGGVESMFALSVLHHENPVLISVVGDEWMNNDPRKYQIKKELEDELVRKFALEFQRVTSNAFALIRRGDAYKNYYVTGLLFYWHCLPICRAFSLGTIYKSSEMEEALNFDYQDLSLHPTFLRHIFLDGEPLLLPLFNCHPKIQMMAELATTPFLPYIYSCFRNTDRRWCGVCTKCYRISEFCDRLGIDRRVIGMQEGIVGIRETGAISRHYWEIADKLYGRKRVRELAHALRHYRKSWRSSLKGVLYKLSQRLW